MSKSIATEDQIRAMLVIGKNQGMTAKAISRALFVESQGRGRYDKEMTRGWLTYQDANGLTETTQNNEPGKFAKLWILTEKGRQVLAAIEANQD